MQEVGKVRRGPKGSLAPFQRFTEFGYQETAFLRFYRKSAGVLHDVLYFLQDVQKGDFGGWMERERWRSDYGGRTRV